MIALRVYGVMDLEFVYAILLANVFASSCDQYAAWIGKKWRKLTRRKPEKAAFSAGEPAMSGTAGGKSHA